MDKKKTPLKKLKLLFAAAIAALPMAASAGIPVSERPAGYAEEKSRIVAALKDEAPLKSSFYRDARVEKMFPPAIPPEGAKIAESLRVIKERDTLTGALLGHYMNGNDVWYRELPLSNIKGNLWGLTYDYYGIVGVNKAKPVYRLLGVTAHETLHLMQKTRGLSEIDPAGDIYSLQSRFLANEAAAHALEVAYALELAQSGDNRAWEGLQTPLIYADGKQTPSPYLGLQIAFQRGYEDGVKAGQSHAEALKAGGRATVSAFLTTEQEKLDIYNEIVLEVYLSRIGTGLKGPGIATWTDEKTVLAGKITEQFSLMDGFSLPAPEQRFGSNREMRWAFEAVELYRKQNGGAAAVEIAALKTKAESGGNPYLGVDMKAALANMPGAVMGASRVRAVSVFNLMTGRTQPKPPAPKATP